MCPTARRSCWARRWSASSPSRPHTSSSASGGAISRSSDRSRTSASSSSSPRAASGRRRRLGRQRPARRRLRFRRALEQGVPRPLRSRTTRTSRSRWPSRRRRRACRTCRPGACSGRTSSRATRASAWRRALSRESRWSWCRRSSAGRRDPPRPACGRGRELPRVGADGRQRGGREGQPGRDRRGGGAGRARGDPERSEPHLPARIPGDRRRPPAGRRASVARPGPLQPRPRRLRGLARALGHRGGRGRLARRVGARARRSRRLPREARRRARLERLRPRAPQLAAPVDYGC